MLDSHPIAALTRYYHCNEQATRLRASIERLRHVALETDREMTRIEDKFDALAEAIGHDPLFVQIGKSVIRLDAIGGMVDITMLTEWPSDDFNSNARKGVLAAWPEAVEVAG